MAESLAMLSVYEDFIPLELGFESMPPVRLASHALADDIQPLPKQSSPASLSVDASNELHSFDVHRESYSTSDELESAYTTPEVYSDLFWKSSNEQIPSLDLIDESKGNLKYLRCNSSDRPNPTLGFECWPRSNSHTAQPSESQAGCRDQHEPVRLPAVSPPTSTQWKDVSLDRFASSINHMNEWQNAFNFIAHSPNGGFRCLGTSGLSLHVDQSECTMPPLFPGGLQGNVEESPEIFLGPRTEGIHGSHIPIPSEPSNHSNRYHPSAPNPLNPTQEYNHQLDSAPETTTSVTPEHLNQLGDFAYRDTDGGDSAERELRDQYLVRSKLAGMSYKQIKAHGHFKEAESTLRGRFRTLTKCKEHRVRKPQWHERDLQLLCQAVHETTVLRDGAADAAGNHTKESKVPWKQVADFVGTYGSYRFGNGTCRKKWDQIRGLRPDQPVSLDA